MILLLLKAMTILFWENNAQIIIEPFLYGETVRTQIFQLIIERIMSIVSKYTHDLQEMSMLPYSEFPRISKQM